MATNEEKTEETPVVTNETTDTNSGEEEKVTPAAGEEKKATPATDEETKEDPAPVDVAADTEETKTSSADDADEKTVANGNSAKAPIDPEKLERSIIRQVEYYFSDANLHRDKFLLDHIKKDEEGWVPFSVLLTFKRLSALSTKVEEIVDALMKSDEGLIEISDDHTKIRRHPERPIPEHTSEHRKEMVTRSAYAKGFPLDSKMEDLIDFFTQFPNVLHIYMRKYLDRPTKTYKFKGSVFATFQTVEQAKEFIEKDKIQFQGRDLLRKWQQKYLDEKSAERMAKKLKKQGKSEPKIELPTGAVIYFDNVADDVTREILREAIEQIDPEISIAYIDFQKGAKEGYIRFQEEDSAANFVKKLTDNKLKLNDDNEIKVNIISDEAEKTYLNKTVELMVNRRKTMNKRDKKGGGHGYRKRRNNVDRNDVSEKKKKIEAE